MFADDAATRTVHVDVAEALDPRRGEGRSTASRLPNRGSSLAAHRTLHRHRPVVVVNMR